MSPAATIRRALEPLHCNCGECFECEAYYAALAALDVLLAVGERDKAEIAELRKRLKAACEPCAECGHCDWRELDDIIPAQARVRPNETREIVYEYLGVALPERIAVDQAGTYWRDFGPLLSLVPHKDGNENANIVAEYRLTITPEMKLRAVLADEEDAE